MVRGGSIGRFRQIGIDQHDPWAKRKRQIGDRVRNLRVRNLRLGFSGGAPSDWAAMGRKGRWVFVPLAKWEALPPDFYSLRQSEIYLTCFLRDVSPGLIDWCLAHDVLPPPRWRRARVESWIRSEAARRVRGNRVNGQAVTRRPEH